MFFSKKKKESGPESKKEQIDIHLLVNGLINNLEKEKQIIIDKALSIHNFFNKEWDEYLLTWNIASRTLQEREDDIKNGIAISKGALPVEVREIFAVLQEKYVMLSKQMRSAYEND
jgi:hypothetical protein